MIQHEFINRIRSLYNIDWYRLPELNDAQWLKFRADPPRYLISLADQVQRNAIMREVENEEARRMWTDTKLW